MRRIAVMQPYFMPYAGYFRLFAAADLVVLFDCVQFPRRGRVHRNQLPLADGRPDWLTLPIDSGARDTRIGDVVFNHGRLAEWPARLARFPSLLRGASADHQVLEETQKIGGGFVDYIERGLSAVCKAVDLPFNVIRSSELSLDGALKGEDRVIAIVELLGGRTYINPPGGVSYYNADRFHARGIELRFLCPFSGPSWSILHRLMIERSDALAQEIRRETAFL